MRGILLALALLGAVLLVPAAAEAHSASCFFGDVKCWINCHVHHIKFPRYPEHSCHWVHDP